ncbi:uncharacterized protein LOC109823442 isoform X1 [Asparagus officinalis]|uniref:uncharacterized protein LOC109823442 isoform X1 n=1 Tax=Asparagus officinalis TaxID=4686 RepID=UPI00098E0646|nr:uncharacterized protein LOC109823442 isoform X1 [Asparagus officinalis]
MLIVLVKLSYVYWWILAKNSTALSFPVEGIRACSLLLKFLSMNEVMYAPGMSMLNIFKDSPLSTSTLDDFMFYEERQKIMQKEKCRFTGRSYETYIPTIVSAEKSSDSAGQSGSSNQIAKLDGGQTSVTSGQPLNADVELTECRIYCYLSDIHVFVLTLTLALSSIWQSLLFTNCCFSV